MGRPAKLIPRTIVEECEVVEVSDTSACAMLRIPFGYLPTRGGGRRFCILCPRCGRRAFKLYRPPHSPLFACRVCHDLSYTSVQKHDARIDQLLRVPDREIVRLLEQNKNMTWKLLALRAGYIRIGVIGKYQ